MLLDELRIYRLLKLGVALGEIDAAPAVLLDKLLSIEATEARAAQRRAKRDAQREQRSGGLFRRGRRR